jgi:membrane protease YdiL (CAAX protease family)
MELYYRRLSVLALVLGLFVLAFGLGRGVRLAADAIVGLGPPGTASRLLYGVLGLQFLGFGVGAMLVLTRRERPLSYLRIGPFDVWTVFYGAAVGLGLMLVTVGATVLARTVETGPTAAASLPTDPMYYVVLLVASTLVVAPMEEVFFRGIVQRRLEDVSHPAVAITVASLLFMTVHVTITYGSTGELISVGLFFGAGVVLGASYYLRRNLLVPVVGHAVFNGVQIVVQIVEII